MHDKFVAQEEAKAQVLKILKSNAEDEVIQKGLTKIFAKMVKLDLRFEQLKDKDAEHLSAALAKNKTIKSLNVAHNYIKERGVKYFADALAKNKAICAFYINSNPIGLEGVKHIIDVLENNNKIRIIDLNQNTVMDPDVKRLAQILKENNTLQSLQFSKLLISNEVIEEIQSVMKLHNISITSLGAGLDQSEQFKTVLEQNKKIQPLMEELVEMHSKLPEPIYENITEAVKARSVFLYNTRLLSVLCKDIYKNNSAAKISCCPPEIFYEIFKTYNEPKLQEFKTKYGEIPTVCRATLELAIDQIKAEISR